MAISTNDRLLIHELLALHGHLMDSGELDHLSALFTTDVVYDLTPLGGSCLYGPTAVRDAALELGDRNPVAHHITNVVIDESNGTVTARSKFLGVRMDGSVGTGTYDDLLRLTASGWRIARRRISVRRQPLQP